MTTTQPTSTERLRGATAKVTHRVGLLEKHPILGFPLASYRRFKEIEGKQLAFVIAGDMFISVIPLFIIGYAIIEAFNPNRSIAVVVIQRFRLSGESAALVRSTFANAKSGRNVALSLSLVSLLITGLSVATTVQKAYARAFRVEPLRGAQRFIRGWAWLILVLAVTGSAMTLRYWAHSRPWWFLFLIVPVLAAVSFAFYLVTPRLLLDVPFAWRDLVPGAAICVVAYALVNAISALLMRKWLGFYGHAYGGFGVALAFLSWVGVISTFWVWIGAIAAIYWERYASPAELTKARADGRDDGRDYNDGVIEWSP